MMITTLNIERKHKIPLFQIIQGNLVVFKLSALFQRCFFFYLVNIRLRIKRSFPEGWTETDEGVILGECLFEKAV